jgi:hypothetical protein
LRRTVRIYRESYLKSPPRRHESAWADFGNFGNFGNFGGSVHHVAAEWKDRIFSAHGNAELRFEPGGNSVEGPEGIN